MSFRALSVALVGDIFLVSVLCYIALESLPRSH